MDEFQSSCRTRLCFSSATICDYLLDRFSKHEIQDLIVFFGADEMGNVVLLCINQAYNCKQSNSFVFIRDHTGLEFTIKETVNAPFQLSGWNTPSLQFHCIVPMQTWRIVFSGRMRWKPFGFPVYCNQNNAFTKDEIGGFDDLWLDKPVIPRSGYDQFGQISGVMTVDNKTKIINIDSIKLRRWDLSVNDSAFLGFTNDGICSIQNLERANSGGHLKTNSGHEILTSSKIRFSLEASNSPRIISVQQKNFKFNTSLENRSSPIMLDKVSVETVFGDGFKGILLSFGDEPKNVTEIKNEQNWLKTVRKPCADLTLSLNSEMCAYSDLVGNKAKSLFRLNKSIANGLINNAAVPDGICITTTAMKVHMDTNEDLSNEINDAIKLAKENDFESLSNCCERCSSGGQMILSWWADFLTFPRMFYLEATKMLKTLWLSSKLSTELSDAIAKRVGGRGTYAVRSSSTYEDGELLSSAGQYVTVLGCGPNDIANAVLECWSSNFSARALTYRTNNGQPLTCYLAVIVQDQVDGQVVGVAFTRDPNSGDPDKITIAASHGLDEAVVSGSAEPDCTAVITRPQFICSAHDGKRDDGFATRSSAVQSFVIENDEKGSVKQRCASDDLLKKLADLCVQVENVFGTPQDIEWAAVGDRVYLLQTRPMTSVFIWKDEEIAREFDTPLKNDDVVMFYNVKEVYPEPVHPLSLTTDFISAYPLFKLTEKEVTDIYRYKQLCYTRYNMCLNVCQLFQDLEPNSVYVKIIEYSIAGKCFLTSDIWEKILSKNQSSAFKKVYKSFSTFKEIFYLESRLAEAHQLVENVNVDDSGRARNLWHEINRVTTILEKVNFCHVASTTNNIVSHTLLATLGFNFNKDSTPETLTNLATSIHTPDIINVSILNDIQAIADVVVEMPSKQEFCDLPVENCYNWLRLNCEKGYDLVKDFIRKYGYRGVQELDFGSETWSTDPNRLFLCLQSLASSTCQSFAKPSQNHSNPATGGYIKKMALGYLLKRYRQSVLYREQSKDMLVQITHKLRMSYRKLGEKLVQEEKMPDSKLIFFLSQYELDRICGENNPEMIHKALRRRKLWPSLSSLQFDDVCCGSPVPTVYVADEVPSAADGATRLYGCCVFPGRVKNRACVVDRVEDARDRLRTGDVLIAKSVDIAWSPYFPIISGLVTEIGGVISHGAVVAREYGLPCLVGVRNVKKHFNTGDTVVLDSENGFVCKEDAATMAN